MTSRTGRLPTARRQAQDLFTRWKYNRELWAIESEGPTAMPTHFKFSFGVGSYFKFSFSLGQSRDRTPHADGGLASQRELDKVLARVMGPGWPQSLQNISNKYTEKWRAIRRSQETGATQGSKSMSTLHHRPTGDQADDLPSAPRHPGDNRAAAPVLGKSRDHHARPNRSILQSRRCGATDLSSDLFGGPADPVRAKCIPIYLPTTCKSPFRCPPALVRSFVDSVHSHLLHR